MTTCSHCQKRCDDLWPSRRQPGAGVCPECFWNTTAALSVAAARREAQVDAQMAAARQALAQAALALD
jgi:hypothetical protein